SGANDTPVERSGSTTVLTPAVPVGELLAGWSGLVRFARIAKNTTRANATSTMSAAAIANPRGVPASASSVAGAGESGGSTTTGSDPVVVTDAVPRAAGGIASTSLA